MYGRKKNWFKVGVFSLALGKIKNCCNVAIVCSFGSLYQVCLGKLL